MAYVQYKNSKDYNPRKEWALTPEQRDDLMAEVWDDPEGVGYQGLRAKEIENKLNHRDAVAREETVISEAVLPGKVEDCFTWDELQQWQRWARMPWWRPERWLYRQRHRVARQTWLEWRVLQERQHNHIRPQGPFYWAVMTLLPAVGLVTPDTLERLRGLCTEVRKIPFDEVQWQPAPVDRLYGDGTAWSSFLFVTAEEVERLMADHGYLDPDATAKEARASILAILHKEQAP